MRCLLCIVYAFLAAFSFIWGGLAFAQDIVSAEVANVQGSTRIVLTFSGEAPEPDKYFRIKDSKPRLVMDWDEAGYIMNHANNKVIGLGIVSSIRYARRAKGTRIVIDVNEPDVSIARTRIDNQLILTFVGDTAGSNATKNRPAAVAPVQSVPRVAKQRHFSKTSTPYPVLKPIFQSPRAVAKALRRPVIVIDPGHGGYDPGALGQKGTKEKQITFAASKELQRQLLATGRYDVIITRSKDVYVDHEERLRIARAGGADLFISIHADSAGPTARGATVYTLADRAKTRSRRLVNSQNWIMDVDLAQQTDPVGDILVDLAQRSTQSASTKFADILLGRLKNTTRLINNSHRRAGYFVLLAPDVPAVLLELGYLSHPSDEKLLKSAAHRKKLMRSVTSAINSYFDTQRP